MNRFAGRVALMATLGLPNAALAQTTVPGDAATPGNPPATMGAGTNQLAFWYA